MKSFICKVLGRWSRWVKVIEPELLYLFALCLIFNWKFWPHVLIDAYDEAVYLGGYEIGVEPRFDWGFLYQLWYFLLRQIFDWPIFAYQFNQAVIITTIVVFTFLILRLSKVSGTMSLWGSIWALIWAPLSNYPTKANHFYLGLFLIFSFLIFKSKKILPIKVAWIAVASLALVYVRQDSLLVAIGALTLVPVLVIFYWSQRRQMIRPLLLPFGLLVAFFFLILNANPFTQERSFRAFVDHYVLSKKGLLGNDQLFRNDFPKSNTILESVNENTKAFVEYTISNWVDTFRHLPDALSMIYPKVAINLSFWLWVAVFGTVVLILFHFLHRLKNSKEETLAKRSLNFLLILAVLQLFRATVTTTLYQFEIKYLIASLITFFVFVLAVAFQNRTPKLRHLLSFGVFSLALCFLAKGNYENPYWKIPLIENTKKLVAHLESRPEWTDKRIAQTMGLHFFLRWRNAFPADAFREHGFQYPRQYLMYNNAQVLIVPMETMDHFMKNETPDVVEDTKRYLRDCAISTEVVSDFNIYHLKPNCENL